METVTEKIFTITENGFLVDGSGKVTIPECKVKANGYMEAVALLNEFLETRSLPPEITLVTPWEKIAFEPLKTKTPEQLRECARLQKELCDSNPNYKGWHFAPHDGVCYSCNKNIYQNYGERAGYTGKSYITGCCHCMTSYCD